MARIYGGKRKESGAEGGTLSNTSFALVLQAFVDFPKNSRLFLFRTDRTDSPWCSQLYLSCSQDLRTNELNFENLDYCCRSCVPMLRELFGSFINLILAQFSIQRTRRNTKDPAETFIEIADQHRSTETQTSCVK